MLLWLVYRRSNVARVIFIVLAAFGLALFALASLDNPTVQNTALALLYAVQVTTMLVGPVKGWTRAGTASQPASPAK